MIENQATICRVTCGWPLPGLTLAHVRRFWRDVHSPAIARRRGIHEYRHNQFARVRANLFPAVPGIDYSCPADAQLQWQSDVRYADQAALDQFGADPDPEVKQQLLSDIDMLVDRSTTYLVLGRNGHTFKDVTSDPAPLGPCTTPSFGLFFRMRGSLDSFRTAMAGLAEAWSSHAGVLRLRLSLFEIPDIEAERKAGYPIKTHPPEQQYQAWIDLAVTDDSICRELMNEAGQTVADCIAAIHAYPNEVVYTFNYAGRPTLAGLRGYSAVEAMSFFGAPQHRDPGLLTWMYGPVAAGGPSA